MNGRTIIKRVAAEYKVRVVQLLGNERKKPLPEARRMAALFLDRASHDPSEIARLLKISDKNIRSIIEQAKDERVFYRDVQKHFNNLLKTIENVGETETE